MPDAVMSIFLSHSSTDRAECDAYVRALRGAGADVWYDEHNLGAGELMEEIQQEMRRRLVFVVLLSPQALASKWVARECKWAYTLADLNPSRIILPVVVRAIEPQALADTMLFLADYKRIEGPGHQPYAQAEAISRTLSLLALTAQGAAPVVVTPQPAESLTDLLTQGRALSAQNKHAEALPFFQRATQLDPNSFDAWFNLGARLNLLNRYAEALPAHERATTLDPNNADAWSNKSAALSSVKRYDEALTACDRALALDPNNAVAWYNKGVALRILKRYDEALAAYDRAIAINPNYANALGNKGSTLRRLGRNEESLRVFEQALAVAPAHANNWRMKADTLRALGRTAEAEEADRRAKELGG